MTDERKALHDQAEQVREEDIDCLADLINRFLHPLESPASQRIVFDPLPPGSITPADIEEQRQQAMARLRARQSEMITRSIGNTAMTRLGIDPNKIGGDRCSSSSSGGKSANFTASWFEGRVFNRLGMFHLKEQQVVTVELCLISEAQPELIYKVRVLTPNIDVEKELTVRI
jgi:hypothetical protein